MWHRYGYRLSPLLFRHIPLRREESRRVHILNCNIIIYESMTFFFLRTHAAAPRPRKMVRHYVCDTCAKFLRYAPNLIRMLHLSSNCAAMHVAVSIRLPMACHVRWCKQRCTENVCFSCAAYGLCCRLGGGHSIREVPLLWFWTNRETWKEV